MPYFPQTPDLIEQLSRAKYLAEQYQLSEQLRAAAESRLLTHEEFFGSMRFGLNSYRHQEIIDRAGLLRHEAISDRMGLISDDQHRHQEMIDAVLALDQVKKIYDEQWLRSSTLTGLSNLDIVLDRARRDVEAAQLLDLPREIELYGSVASALLPNILQVQSHDWWDTASHLSAFNSATAIANLLVSANSITGEFEHAVSAYVRADLPELGALKNYRNFFDAAGLTLNRWPNVRLLTKAQKRQHFRRKLLEKSEKPHQRQAKSLVHRYERVLIEIIDDLMSVEFGEYWAAERLPECECKGLLGRWQKHGGNVLEHADYTHYALIMTHPAHYSAIFAAGFENPNQLKELILKAGELRAKSHHPRDFTPADLRDLRLTWRTIEIGLLAFADDYELVDWR